MFAASCREALRRLLQDLGFGVSVLVYGLGFTVYGLGLMGLRVYGFGSMA